MASKRFMTLATMVVLLVSSLAIPAMAQDLPEDCDEYPLGECLDESEETDDRSQDDSSQDDTEDAEVQDVVLTHDADDEDPQVLGTTLARTGAGTALLLVGGLALALAGLGTLFFLRRRSSTQA